ncbi:Rcs stress response system protein RcsF [Thalassotalea agarivorans]|uniref:RcsF protein n=1 Tax=Thalassotalea agarivorans TaxID=349064 RepID=A0A1I0DMA1_THASX|nr:Rcs stress response system protein RcsF [Thalassotalea agarivorans]SET32977.1 RcsF protein [Thalassotalea agarivorans]
MKCRHTYTAALLASLIACTNNYNVKTNLDKENFDNYFAPGKVQVLTDTSDPKFSYKQLGIVEGEDCQKKAHLAKPEASRARTDARSKAHALGANAIVFSGCADIPSNQCVAAIVCYGQAFQVIEK